MREKRLLLIVVILVVCVRLSSIPGAWGESKPVLTINSKAAALMDADTGKILFTENPGERMPPASLAKMMTLHLALDAVKRGEAKFDDEVLVSKRAWKMGGSQMFLEVGDKVAFLELIKGAAAISANDGAMAIAEFLSGAEEVFVHEMNEKAKAIGMENTHFVNPHGLPKDGQYTSAMDMALLGYHYMKDHPDALQYHGLQWYEYGGIKQKNWNPLLNKDLGVDGLKTGYIKASGYHILFTAKKDGRRLIGIVMGGQKPQQRNGDARKLIGYGFKNFSNKTLVKKGEVVATVQVPGGDPPEVNLVATQSMVVTIRKGQEESIPLKREIPASVDPPISQGAVLGKFVLDGEGFPGKVVELIATQDVQVKSYLVFYLIGGAVVACLFGLAYVRRRTHRRGR
jgi:D-alanyl-D-alanine carboxypeptidase (penicillin-binding protein 5/6)